MLKYTKQKEVKLFNWVLPIPSPVFEQSCKDYQALREASDSPRECTYSQNRHRTESGSADFHMWFH